MKRNVIISTCIIRFRTNKYVVFEYFLVVVSIVYKTIYYTSDLMRFLLRINIHYNYFTRNMITSVTILVIN